MCDGGIRSTLLLLQALHKWRLGSLVSLYLLGPEFSPTAHACCCFQSYTLSLYFVVPGEVCPGAALQQRASFPAHPNRTGGERSQKSCCQPPTSCSPTFQTWVSRQVTLIFCSSVLHICELKLVVTSISQVVAWIKVQT